MTPNPKMCTPNDKVEVAINLMWDHDCGAVPVVKDLESKELIGMVTDRDIAMHLVRHAYSHPSQVKVADCMSTNVIACQLEDAVASAIQLMSEHRVRRLPVVDKDGSCVGIISQADLLSRAAANMKDIIALLQQISIPHNKGEKELAETAAKEETSAAEKKEVTSAATEKTEAVPKKADSKSGGGKKKKRKS
jgi:CBS-domain-containing membrane protein